MVQRFQRSYSITYQFKDITTTWLNCLVNNNFYKDITAMRLNRYMDCCCYHNFAAMRLLLYYLSHCFGKLFSAPRFRTRGNWFSVFNALILSRTNSKISPLRGSIDGRNEISTKMSPLCGSIVRLFANAL